MAAQRPLHNTDSTMKWMFHVAKSNRASITCSAANVVLVATNRVGVGPGVKMDSQRPCRKEAIATVESYVDSFVT